MKKNTKSSVTLPPQELKLVEELQKKLGAKSKVEVIRQGLKKLKELTDREALRKAYADAARATKDQTPPEVFDLDGLSDEGLDEA